MEDKIIDLFYEGVQNDHPDYTDEQVMWSVNQDDIMRFVDEVKDVLSKEFGGA